MRRPLPVRKPGECLVRIHAASINPVDVKNRTGTVPKFLMAKDKARLLATTHVQKGKGGKCSIWTGCMGLLSLMILSAAACHALVAPRMPGAQHRILTSAAAAYSVNLASCWSRRFGNFLRTALHGGAIDVLAAPRGLLTLS